jgi:hypothetical protein
MPEEKTVDLYPGCGRSYSTCALLGWGCCSFARKLRRKLVGYEVQEHEEVIQELLNPTKALTGREKAAAVEITNLRNELKQIDITLARRDALDSIPTRTGKITKAINVAGHCEGQIDRLAKYIMDNVPGEPSQNQGAVETAIRLLRQKPKVPATVEISKDNMYQITWSRGNDKTINRPAAIVYVDRPDAVLELIYILAGITEINERHIEAIPGDKVKIFSNQQFPKLADSVIVTKEVWRDANNSG